MIIFYTFRKIINFLYKTYKRCSGKLKAKYKNEIYIESDMSEVIDSDFENDSYGSDIGALTQTSDDIKNNQLEAL